MNNPSPHPDDTSAFPANLRHGHAIVAGFGLIGRMVAEGLDEAGLSVTIVELNARTIERQASLDRTVVYGDISDPDTLRRAGIDRADALIVTIPNEDAAIQACRTARQLHPELIIAVRANFASRGHLATEAGADVVVVEEIVTAQAMQRAVVEKLVGE